MKRCSSTEKEEGGRIVWPFELLINILSYLSLTQRIQYSTVCKEWACEKNIYPCIERLYDSESEYIEASLMQKCNNLTSLKLVYSSQPTDRIVSKMTRLSFLILDMVPNISPASLQGMKMLQTLHLIGIINIIVDDLACLTGLTSLTIHRHVNASLDFKETHIPMPFLPFTNLTSLSLSHTRYFPSKSLKSLRLSLRTLKLRNNESINTKSVSKLTALTELDLSYDSYIEGEALLTLTRLKVLNLDYNDVVRSEHISHLRELESLSIILNHRIAPSALTCLHNLQHLKLTAVSIGDNPNCFKLLTNLRSLQCSSRALENPAIQALPLLTDLNISGLACITPSIFQPFSRILKLHIGPFQERVFDLSILPPSLTALSLGEAKSTSSSVRNLSTLTRLQELQFYNEFSCLYIKPLTLNGLSSLTKLTGSYNTLDALSRGLRPTIYLNRIEREK
jgi:hypothetical protein